jgi:hypothetical protein
MAILTSGYVDNSIGTATRAALAGTGGSDRFAQYEEQARTTVIAKCKVAGYTIATNDANAMVKELVLGQWYIKALGYKKGMQLPPLIAEQVNLLVQVQDGRVPIPGKTPSGQDAIGGVKFSGSTKSGRFQYFSRSELNGNW